ncbi:MAG TPA: c-type cytochrome [Bryobacteraceae bacterium]
MRLLGSLLFVMALCAQQPQDAPKKGGGGGRGFTPKNLKVLKPDANIRQVMGSFTSGLGVRCDFCHVQGDFASDENPKKDIARMMITMAQDINGKFPDGKEHVACYTCHRGENIPKLAAPPAAPAQ